MTSPKEFLYQMAQLTMGPRDLLIIKVNGNLSPEQAQRAHGMIKSEHPGLNYMLIDASVDVTLLTHEEIESRRRQ